MLGELLDRLNSGNVEVGQAQVMVTGYWKYSKAEALSADLLFLQFLQICFITRTANIIEEALEERYKFANAKVRFVSDPSQSGLNIKWRVENGISFFYFQDMRGFLLTVLVARWLSLIPLFQKLHDAAKDASAIFNVDDAGDGSSLSFCDNRAYQNLIPDCEYLGSNAYAKARLAYSNSTVAWAGRSNKVLWRGSTTGRRTSAHVLSLPRIKLCQMAKNSPDDIFDVGITSVVQCDKEDENIVLATDIMASFVSSDKYCNYKYHIDIDGNTNSWSALFLKLLSGGLVFKVSSPEDYRQWFYERLIPWKHFIPIASDLSDLMKVVDQIRNDDRKARRIADEGQRLAQSMDLESELSRGVETVTRYSSSFSFDTPKFYSTATPVNKGASGLQDSVMFKLFGRNIWVDYSGGVYSGGVDGWNGNHPILSHLASIDDNKCIFDVGAWKGQASIEFAKTLKEKSIDGCVVSIDTFLGASEHHSSFDEVFYKRDFGRPDLYETFLTNVTHHDLQRLVVPLPQSALEAAKILKKANIRADIIHIDTSHSREELLLHYKAYWDLLRQGGYMIGDDYDASWPEVILAANEFAEAVNHPLQIEWPKWVIRKAIA